MFQLLQKIQLTLDMPDMGMGGMDKLGGMMDGIKDMMGDMMNKMPKMSMSGSDCGGGGGGGY